MIPRHRAAEPEPDDKATVEVTLTTQSADVTKPREGNPAGDAASLRRGIAWMLGAVLGFAVMDAIAKYLSYRYPVLQVAWARNTFQAVIVLAVFANRLPQIARTRRLGLQLLRSGMLLMANIAFIFGLRAIPLADASTILFLAPLIVTALSVPLLRERVGLRRWIAVFAGFGGALIIIRPGAGIMDTAAIFPVTTAVLYALYMIATRYLSRTDSAYTTIFYTGLVGAVALSLVAPFVWQAPDLEGWVLMIVLGTMGGICHFALIRAFEAAPAAVISPFDYSRLIWATALGFVIFGDLPDRWTVLGAAVIVGAGLYIYRRERDKGPQPDPAGAAE